MWGFLVGRRGGFVGIRKRKGTGFQSARRKKGGKTYFGRKKWGLRLTGTGVPTPHFHVNFFITATTRGLFTHVLFFGLNLKVVLHSSFAIFVLVIEREIDGNLKGGGGFRGICRKHVGPSPGALAKIEVV